MANSKILFEIVIIVLGKPSEISNFISLVKNSFFDTLGELKFAGGFIVSLRPGSGHRIVCLVVKKKGDEPQGAQRHKEVIGVLRARCEKGNIIASVKNSLFEILREPKFECRFIVHLCP